MRILHSGGTAMASYSMGELSCSFSSVLESVGIRVAALKQLLQYYY